MLCLNCEIFFVSDAQSTMQRRRTMKRRRVKVKRDRSNPYVRPVLEDLILEFAVEGA
jgi:hypothetical protein